MKIHNRFHRYVVMASLVALLSWGCAAQSSEPQSQPTGGGDKAAPCPKTMPKLTGYYTKRHPPVAPDLKAPLLVCKYDGRRIDLNPKPNQPVVAGDMWGDYSLAERAVIGADDIRQVARLVKTAPPHPQKSMYIEGPDPRTPVFLRLPTMDGAYTWVWMESVVSAYSFGGELRAVPKELIGIVEKIA